MKFELMEMKKSLENEIIRISNKLNDYEGTDEAVFADYAGYLKGLVYAIKCIDKKTCGQDK